MRLDDIDLNACLLLFDAGRGGGGGGEGLVG